MNSIQYGKESRMLLVGFMLMFALCGSFALLLDNYYLLCIPFGALLLITSINSIDVLFFFLILLIPFSIEQKVTTSISIDFPDEILMWIITAILWVVILFKKNIRKNMLGLQHPIWRLVALTLVWIFVCILFSSYPTVSTKHFLSKLWYISCFFILPVLLFSKEQHIKRIFQVLIFSMLIIVFYAFIKQISINFSFLRVNETVRPFFRNHVNYSALLACIIPPLIIGLWHCKSYYLKLFIILATAMCFINLIFTYSRGAWLGLLACLAFYFILRKRMIKPFMIGLFSFLLFFTFIFVGTGLYKKIKTDRKVTVYHTDFKDHLQATYELTDMSFAERFHRWIGGVRMLKAKPIFGFGPNTFYFNYKAYTLAEFETWVSANYEKSSIHNYYLLQFAEQGIIGGSLFILLIFFAFVKVEELYYSHVSIKSYALGIGYVLVVICVELFVNDLIETDKIGSVFYLSLASLIILEKSLSKSMQKKLPENKNELIPTE